ncbi:hypothetical protein [Steroidobacter cummioxidans]|uniref:hypothetical protein n=1 Tax=Steroidobacter cummioxidans TaxID=1803913 RepID=UPI000E31F870|nr:hypothetical protein [Steroidobacter cummioxidans]
MRTFHRLTSLRSFFVGALLLGASVSANAVTHCQGRVTRIFADASLHVWFDNGLNWAKVPTFGSDAASVQSQATVKSIQATIMAAMAMDRSVTVRFFADGVSCTGDQTGQQVWGVYLNST